MAAGTAQREMLSTTVAVDVARHLWLHALTKAGISEIEWNGDGGGARSSSLPSHSVTAYAPSGHRFTIVVLDDGTEDGEPALCEAILEFPRDTIKPLKLDGRKLRQIAERAAFPTIRVATANESEILLNAEERNS